MSKNRFMLWLLFFVHLLHGGLLDRAKNKPLQVRSVSDFKTFNQYCHYFYRHARRTRTKLQKALNDVAKNFYKSYAIIPPLKSYKRAKVKVEKDFNGDWRKLTDLVRGSLSFQNEEDLEEAIKQFGRYFPIVYKEDRLTNPLPSGYKDVLILFQDPDNKIIGEVQFHLCHILQVKNKEHALYEERQAIARKALEENRALSKQEEEQIQELRARSKKIYRAANQKMQSNIPCAPKAAPEQVITAVSPVCG